MSRTSTARKATTAKAAIKKAAPSKRTNTKQAAPQKAGKIKLTVITKQAASPTIAIGLPAPAFKLKATDIGEISNTRMKGRAFILYFYPKDGTSGCTAEACNFRDAMPDFVNMGVAIIGISKDSLATHEKFKSKFDIEFPLASDETGKVCADYGVWVEKSLHGRKYMGVERSTFLIDAKGIIRAIWHDVSVPGHVDKVKKAAAQL